MGRLRTIDAGDLDLARSLWAAIEERNDEDEISADGIAACPRDVSYR
jgi:hypothetical protein